MLSMECINSIEGFHVGVVYEVANNYTLLFEIVDERGNKRLFSKVYDSEHPNFRNYFNVKQLDKDTLEFAIKIAWQFEFTCKNTKEGRTMAAAFSRVQRTLQHYLQQIEQE